MNAMEGAGLAAVLELIAGVIFVFILLSIVVTEINVLIAKVAKLRARNLRQSLNGIIEDPVLRAKVYTHPLIQLVKAEPVAPSQRISRVQASAVARSPIGKVEYIEPAAFVDVVLSTIKAESNQRLFGALLNVIDGMPASAERRQLRQQVNRVINTGQGIDTLRDSLRFVRDNETRAALRAILTQIHEEISQLGIEPSGNVALMAGIKQVENPKLRKTLSAVLYSADSMEAAHSKLEAWFNSTMQRASASYTARMKNLSLVVALALALLFNIDALQIAQALWDDPTQRAQLSSQAQLSAQTGDLPSRLDDDFSAQDEGEELTDLLGSGAQIAYQIEDIQALSLPIGWVYVDVSEQPALQADSRNLWNYLPENNSSEWLGLLASKLIGIGLTVIAGAQGAPFWFGIVNRILRR